MKVLLNLKDPVFEDKYAESYFLILSHFYNQAVLLEYYPEFNRFIGIKHLVSETNDFLSDQSLLESDLFPDFNYRKKILLLSGNRFTLVPDEFFKKNKDENIFNLNFKPEIGEQIESSKLEELNTHIIYAQDGKFSDLIAHYNPSHIVNSAQSFLKGSAHSSNVKEEKHIRIDVEVNHIKILFFKQEQLFFYNAFPYNTMEDVLYHILNVSKQLGLHPNEDIYYFSGFIEKSSESFKLLHKYLRYPELLKRPVFFSFSSIFDELNTSMYFSSFSSILCV